MVELIPNKEELNVIRIYTHKGEAVTVYADSRNPILFEIEKALYPTGMGSGVEESSPSLQAFKARLDVALGSLVWWLETLCIAGGWT